MYDHDLAALSFTSVSIIGWASNSWCHQQADMAGVNVCVNNLLKMCDRSYQTNCEGLQLQLMNKHENGCQEWQRHSNLAEAAMICLLAI